MWSPKFNKADIVNHLQEGTEKKSWITMGLIQATCWICGRDITEITRSPTFIPSSGHSHWHKETQTLAGGQSLEWDTAGDVPWKCVFSLYSNNINSNNLVMLWKVSYLILILQWCSSVNIKVPGNLSLRNTNLFVCEVLIKSVVGKHTEIVSHWNHMV